MKKIISAYTSLFLAASLILAPALVLAKDNKGHKESRGNEGLSSSASMNASPNAGFKIKETATSSREEKAEKKEEKRERNCLRAFGHLIAPGWIKLNGNLSLGEHCSLPFGIAKKFKGIASTTPDTVAPAITNVMIDALESRAWVRWTTNERADSAVFFGQTTPVDTSASTTRKVEMGGLAINHRVVLSGLSASTTYFAVVRSRDTSGNVSFSDTVSFTTKGPAPATDITPPVISGIVTLSGTTTVQVGWKTNEPATSKVYYGLSAPLDISAGTTLSVGDIGLVTSHSLNLSGLSTSTPYRVIIESKDAAGNTTRSGEFLVTTSF